MHHAHNVVLLSICECIPPSTKKYYNDSLNQRRTEIQKVQKHNFTPPQSFQQFLNFQPRQPLKNKQFRLCVF